VAYERVKPTYVHLSDQILLCDLQSQSRMTNFVLSLCTDAAEAVIHLRSTCYSQPTYATQKHGLILRHLSSVCCFKLSCKKVKQPGVAKRVPGGLGSQIFITFGT
jgi:hypothetical protein